MPRSPVWYFERIGFLEGLSPQQQAVVERDTRTRDVKRGEAIYQAGDPPDHVYIIKTGAIKIVGTAPEGGDVILTVLTPGDIFGELALTDSDAQDHRAEAADDSVLCELPRELLTRMIQEAPAFGLHLTKLMGLGLQTFRARVQELLGKSAPARLAHTLLDLSDHHGVHDGQGVLLPLRLSQGDLGKLVGLTRETVNGIIQVWRDQGLVEMDRRTIRLRDPERLRRVR